MLPLLQDLAIVAPFLQARTGAGPWRLEVGAPCSLEDGAPYSLSLMLARLKYSC